jgi:membrane protease subunit HflK
MTEFHVATLPAEDLPPEPEGTRFGKAHHVLMAFLGLVLLVWLLSGFYQVKADEIAIVERLGQYRSTPEGKVIQMEKGLHYHLPWPIDQVHKVSTQQTATLRVSTFDAAPDAYADFKAQMQRRGWSPQVLAALYDPYLITGDKSVVHMDISIVYRINDPEAWLNTLAYDQKGPDQRLQVFQELAQHAMIRQISRMTLDQALFSGLQTLPQVLQSRLQDELQIPDPDHPGQKKGMGVQLQKVEIVRMVPPDPAKDAYNMVIQARSTLETTRTNAQAVHDAAVTKAQGQKTTLITDAERERTQTVEEARGEADRFKQVLVQFTANPESTRWNLFLDAARSVVKSAKRIIFAQPGQKTYIQVDPPQLDAGQPPASQ